MTRIFTSTLTLPTSGNLNDSPLPKFKWQQPMPLQSVPPIGLSAEETEGYVALGQDSMLPYLEQTGYGRDLTDQTHETIVIENGHLRATLLPGLGGRLYSLWDKQAARELLFCNPVLQFANLSLRNAWFSGGIEWNGGSLPGHTPSTCDPIFAHLVETDRGPVLRLHDFDRISETAWQIDLFLPADRAALFVHGRIINPNDTPREVYWWSNATVAAKPGLRMISPADYAIEHVLPDNHLEPFPFPDRQGFDGSFPENWSSATSVFFRKPGQITPWIAACQADGNGLAQISTATMKGRKYFYFGTGEGGTHWMDFLGSPGEGSYVELQAGLMPTQNQRRTLAPGASCNWTECYLPFAIPPLGELAYKDAVTASANAISQKVTPDDLSDINDFLSSVATRAVDKTLASGPDWGHLFELIARRSISPGMNFNSTLQTTSPWHVLARTGQMEQVDDTPTSFVTSGKWCDLLERAPTATGGEWLRDLALGIIYMNREDLGTARSYLNASIARDPGWLAYRCLAVLEAREAHLPKADSAYENAIAHAAAPPELFLEFAKHLIDTRQIARASAILERCNTACKSLERYRILRAELALASGDIAQLEHLLDFNFATIREGEETLADLWRGMVLSLADHPGSASKIKEVLDTNPIPSKLNFSLIS